MDHSLAYGVLKVTEKAAIESALWRGKGDKKKADEAATSAMRETLNTLPISATVVIGEGEIDEAPMLYIGEKLGTGGESLDIAVDPLDGTTLTAKNRENAITVIALAKAGTLLHAPDMYMLKLAVGPKAKGVINLSKGLTWNLKEVSKALNKKPHELNIVMLDRDRHTEYLKECREFGCEVTLITDGDVSPVVSLGLEILVHMLFGSGGAPEGVLAAAAARCLGGDFQGQLLPSNEAEKIRCQKMGIQDIEHIFTLKELVKSPEVIFALTGVTHGSLCLGVQFLPHQILTHSLLLCGEEKIMRRVQTTYPV